MALFKCSDSVTMLRDLQVLFNDNGILVSILYELYLYKKYSTTENHSGCIQVNFQHTKVLLPLHSPISELISILCISAKPWNQSEIMDYGKTMVWANHTLSHLDSERNWFRTAYQILWDCSFHHAGLRCTHWAYLTILFPGVLNYFILPVEINANFVWFVNMLYRICFKTNRRL